MRSGPPVGQPRPAPEASLWTSAYTAARLLDGKWVIAILALLGTQPRRHTDLLQALGGQIAGKVLSENLSWMASEGLVTQLDERRTGRYTLTQRGRSLYVLITVIAEWAEADANRSYDDTDETAGDP
jgi:DNA-binding HxlR family transcriptional regulator